MLTKLLNIIEYEYSFINISAEKRHKEQVYERKICEYVYDTAKLTFKDITDFQESQVAHWS